MNDAYAYGFGLYAQPEDGVPWQVNAMAGKSPHKRRLIKEMIRSGKYTMTVGGSIVTDFKAIDEALKQSPKPIPTPRPTPSLATLQERAKRHDRTKRKADCVEHIGDAIVLLASRILAHGVLKGDWRGYLELQARMITNQNFKSYPGIKYADQFETIIGNEYFMKGIEVALDTAKAMLKETEAWGGR